MSDFPDHWQLLPLEEVMEAIIDYRGKTPKKTNEGIPLITAKIVKGGRISEPAEFIAESDYDSWMVRGLPEIGDVVVTSEAPLGEVAQLTDSNVALAQRIVTLRGKKGVLNNDFLLSAMQSSYVQHQLESRASGSTVKGIKQSELRKVLLPIPPEDEQIEIANHIKTLSDKIELNRQTNQTLEQIAQAIFKSWFVDFEPVKAKILAKQNGQDPERAAMCAISGKSLKELEQLSPETQQQLKTTAALFPDALVESELGEIPEGWGVKTLDQVTSNITDGTHSTVKDSPGGDCYLLSCKNIKNGQVVIGNSERTINKETMLNLRKRTKLSEFDVLLTTVGTIGEAAIIRRREIPYELQRSVAIIKPDFKRCTPEFLYQFIKSKRFLHVAIARSEGSVQKCLFLGAINSIEVINPSLNLLVVFDDYVKTLYDKVESNNDENHTLIKIRNTLLPKLLSSELALNEKPRKTEAVA